ncbi:MAG: translation initiation factor IF-2 [Candidatus Magasanikbacteria bacterium RIFCSPLOWO2_01_FULL_43_20b]|uniref:Translation initiation factor IF-2 n=1 Tax=Candidatus Magasanikbacteria bacterium RIFCSPLOWO2_12_FULL_43_12 TaxID=1798692 RepID=A0A1F6MS21_9BACT|nr:MAG: translation initiation factor IF-2 [Candidatus Magasanikbacteria bacterium RIFCSPHIGHO2_02_FULL_44_13]OGH72083.1 MAG: translation initiation factor IF-2 [Candidatus Magasanikbacteria bacterium RIFCSPLOWO2_02_FULL_43_22]OGH73418.1 MAG: translation initiation factor IF-2 [Candidatus Magasanikbacteria bacterium RIFCSPLOWO2_01_FULL_43_20b]OGH74456.1 MAG: translation initiation factor IF-2 [Candidatus Magasanikbacteria bacterium RIFCSPLOWO2_12_FULL_43_12]
MNVSELARQLRTNTKELLEILPQYGFDIGQRAIKVDNKVADQISRRWRFIKKDLEEKKRKAEEEKKQKEKELRKESGHSVILPQLITVRNFAACLNLPITQVIAELMKNGILANQNQNIDFDTASIIAGELGFTVLKEEGGAKIDVEKEDQRGQVLEQALAKAENSLPRAPVIVVMGHVDHGKTRLLDTIRKTNILDTESGGITQHIGAYQTIWKDPKSGAERKLTFIDTPGHEAFTVMRSRGAKVADIAILIVAADDGVKPQTVEVINIIKAAKLPLVVAINKIDKDGADPQRVRAELSQRGIQSDEWGGSVPMVEISAKQNLNIDKLLDVLLLVADMEQEKIKADPNLPAAGTIIESHVDKGMGPVATVLVQSGTLKLNDPLVVNGEIYGKARAMKDYLARALQDAPPSTPVQIVGFKVAPEVGDILDVSQAGQAEKINVKEKKLRQTGAERQIVVAGDEDVEEDKKKKILNLVIKADVLGSLEAIIGTLEKFKHEEVGVAVVGKGLGFVTEDDVNKAEAAKAVVVGFHVNPTSSAENLMMEKEIVFARYDVIYDLFNWVKAELEKMLSSEKIATEIGKVKILAIFRTDRGMMTVGGRVMDGKIKINTLARVIREGVNMGSGKIVQCKVGPQDVKEAIEGTECGMRFEGKVKIEVGDSLEIYTEETKARKIVFEK